MSSSVDEINQSPPHFMVLNAIARGIRKLNNISKEAKIGKEELEQVINDLAVQRLIIINEKKGFFGNKKKEIEITETGLKLLNSKKEELERKWKDVQQMYNNGNKSQLQQYMQNQNNRSWVPLMLFMGIMDIMFFMTMMSFIGMAMNPMEGSMAADSGMEGTDSVGDAGTENVDAGESGDFGGFDFGGFGDF